MTAQKKRILRDTEQKARQRMAQLANSYLHVPPGQREEIQAGSEIERWLGEICREGSE